MSTDVDTIVNAMTALPEWPTWFKTYSSRIRETDSVLVRIADAFTTTNERSHHIRPAGSPQYWPVHQPYRDDDDQEWRYWCNMCDRWGTNDEEDYDEHNYNCTGNLCAICEDNTSTAELDNALHVCPYAQYCFACRRYVLDDDIIDHLTSHGRIFYRCTLCPTQGWVPDNGIERHNNRYFHTADWYDTDPAPEQFPPDEGEP